MTFERFCLHKNDDCRPSDVWSILFRRQVNSGTLPSYFLHGLLHTKFCAEIPPSRQDITIFLEQWGWKAVFCETPILLGQILQGFYDKQIFIPIFIRNTNNLEYTKTADFFVRCFSQLPLFFYDDYRKVLEEFGRLSILSVSDQHQFSEWLERLYWFSVEKGILNCSGGLQSVGVQLIDSATERQYSLVPFRHKTYGMHPVIRTAITPHHYPQGYYVFDSWTQVQRSLIDFERIYKNA